MNTPISLPFSAKYNRTHAEAYWQKHRKGLPRKLSNWREQQLAGWALAQANQPERVLDLPCGAGRFWPTLLANDQRSLIAADNAAAMLDVAQQVHSPQTLARVQLLQTSAFAINLPDNHVDSIFCMRLLHHIESNDHRLALLKECRRVTRDSLIISLWVDGNIKAKRRERTEARRAVRGPGSNSNRFVARRNEIEGLFVAAGFTLHSYKDFLPGYAMWRVYVLRVAHQYEPLS
ncbi:class I SAM-dependent methyltransferase [Halopseudomonas pelagia]|uniref:class I SAM-dependent methyltransferase n=1 Tax=Halopseudomonas pelagia TaxID=553151 RepID=UPI00039AB1C5|nr:class I SAM-dependent methyltransferase [Halopseudomonas pelagia]|tara:strand:- start:65103 stop:65801 length:699 start_codon:yes stop_codon:yes gene_type:complete